MPMYLIFNDASLAEELREAGFCIIYSGCETVGKYMVLNNEELGAYISENHADGLFLKTDTVCF